MELALAELDSAFKPNVLATAKKFNLSKSTLRRRWKGIQLSREEASSKYRKRLTTTQEEVLIERINYLSDRSLSPTSNIIRNLAEELTGGPVGKNWTGNFIKRYKGRLRSIYLQNLDSQRVKAEYPPAFQVFYDLVCPNSRY